MYIFWTLISAFFLGVYNVFKKLSLKKSRLLEVLFFYCFVGFLTSLIFVKYALFTSFIDIVLILIKSIIVGISWYLIAKCMEYLEVGIISLFSLMNTIFIVFGSNFVFNEPITWKHFLSLFFISMGMFFLFFASKKDDEARGKKNNVKYILVLLLATLLSTIGALFDKYLINYRYCDSRSILTWFLFFNSVFYGCVYFAKNRKIEWKNIKKNYWLILTGVSITLADVFYYVAISLTGAQLSIISIIRKMSVLVTVLLSSIFLKEKKLLTKLCILFVMLLGIIIPIIF